MEAEVIRPNASPMFQVRDMVLLLLKRPISEVVAMQIEMADDFKHLEIVDGSWVLDTLAYEDDYMTGEEHGRIEFQLILRLGNYVEGHDLGSVYPGDVDFVLDGTPEDIRLKRKPDVAFVAKARVRKSKGYVYGAPDLAVEIVSPSQSRLEMVQKANEYLLHGAAQVWLVFPAQKRIEVHTADEAAVVYNVGDTLSGGDLLPGFALAVADILAE
ncbi:MAG: Uma2 family endonuclease [Anaerolineae bacterium]|nr:Uma2 family endonuclease [Anaerolineae bacterium]